jgi:hypothetical protein
MKINAVNIEMEAFGAQFANMDDSEQAAFFKGIAGEVRRWESTYNAQMQFHSVSRLVKKEDRDLLSKTLACVWYKED